MTPPRLRGRAGQAIGGEHDGKWFYELHLCTLFGEPLGDRMLFGPYESEAFALARGKEIVRTAAEAVEKATTGEVTGEYLDLKNGGVMRKWEEN